MLKKKVNEKLIYSLTHFNKVFQVNCDASGSTIEAISGQEGKPITLFSENLNESKIKYSNYDI
jgi:hypothetical protein